LVGFDKLFEDVFREFADRKVPTRPPCDIRKVAPNKYVIELAVAGFGKNELEVTLNKDSLSITGRVKVDNQEGNEFYQYNSIAKRGFRRDFKIEDSMVVQNASYFNGMLRVYLERMVTQDETKKIEISDEETVSTKQTLID
jgi:molecular chaperone IbpA